MKELNELLALVASAANSGAEAAADGKLSVADIAFFFDTISKGDAAIRDVNLIPDELRKATRVQKDGVRTLVAAELGAFSEETRGDLAAFTAGLVSIASLIFRAGVERGEELAAARMQEKAAK